MIYDKKSKFGLLLHSMVILLSRRCDRTARLWGLDWQKSILDETLLVNDSRSRRKQEANKYVQI